LLTGAEWRRAALKGLRLMIWHVRSPVRLKAGDGTDGTYNPDPIFSPKEQRKVDDFITYAIVAAEEALKDANWHPEDYEDQIATGVLIGSGIGGISGIVEAGYTSKRQRATPYQSLFHSGPPD
jgi:3-oxoacyl-(acyl-carrier-protein) synthase